MLSYVAAKTCCFRTGWSGSVGLPTCINPEPDPSALEKITFDLNQFDEYGLYGPAMANASLDYEFCIPQGEQYATEVQTI